MSGVALTALVVYGAVVVATLFLADWDRLNGVTFTRAVLWPLVLVAIVLRNIGPAMRGKVEP